MTLPGSSRFGIILGSSQQHRRHDDADLHLVLACQRVEGAVFQDQDGHLFIELRQLHHSDEEEDGLDHDAHAKAS